MKRSGGFPMPETLTIQGSKSLAEQINAEHEACLLSAADAVTHAIKAGILLMEAKESLRRGDFTAWIEDNFLFSVRMAQQYMRIGKSATRCAFVSSASNIREALRMIADESIQEKREPSSSGRVRSTACRVPILPRSPRCARMAGSPLMRWSK